jgi:hypothetical protein
MEFFGDDQCWVKSGRQRLAKGSQEKGRRGGKRLLLFSLSCKVVASRDPSRCYRRDR